jgi:ferric-dicitrate binding protein FerR (iron transport regulator)
MSRTGPLIPVLALALTLVVSGRASAQENIGQVTALTGPASILRDGQLQAVRLGTDIHARDRLRTLQGAKLRITFVDGTRLILGASSQIDIARYAPRQQRQGILELLQGIVRVLMGGREDWQQFDVETRTVVASARSTQWVVDLTSKGTAVFVVEGLVAVRGGKREVILDAGFGIDVAPDTEPTTPKRWGAARVDDVLARTTIRR